MPQETILCQNARPSALGQVTLIAAIEDGRGIVPATPFRIYGSYALVYITCGRGTYSDTRGTAQDIHAGDVIIVFPELPHTYSPRPGETWSELYVVFQGAAFDAWRALGLLHPQVPVRSLTPVDKWAARLRALANGNAATERDARLQVCRLLTLLTEIVSLPEQTPLASPAVSETDQWAARACALMASDLGNDLSPPQIAARAGMSYDAFRRRFGETVGLSPARYRMGRRLEAACDLMQYTSMTGAQIADALGFSDEYHFSRRFTRWRGETPTAFRRLLR